MKWNQDGVQLGNPGFGTVEWRVHWAVGQDRVKTLRCDSQIVVWQNLRSSSVHQVTGYFLTQNKENNEWYTRMKLTDKTHI